MKFLNHILSKINPLLTLINKEPKEAIAKGDLNNKEEIAEEINSKNLIIITTTEGCSNNKI